MLEAFCLFNKKSFGTVGSSTGWKQYPRDLEGQVKQGCMTYLNDTPEGRIWRSVFTYTRYVTVASNRPQPSVWQGLRVVIGQILNN